jgi:hypothetical protein
VNETRSTTDWLVLLGPVKPPLGNLASQGANMASNVGNAYMTSAANTGNAAMAAAGIA